MANYYSNHLIIRGEQAQVRRFQDDALPRDGEQADDSWGGHGEGSLSFFSLLPPPKELQCDAAVSHPEESLYHWQMQNWGCTFPDLLSCDLTDNCLEYRFYTRHFCAHNFVANVSRLYPALAFRLVWRDVYSGEYGTPINFALLVVRDGVISHDFVKMSGKLLTSMLKDLDKAASVYFDYEVSNKESDPDPSMHPRSPDAHLAEIYGERTIQGPTTDEMQAARRTWPAVPESQTVGEFLSSRGNRAALAIEDGPEIFVLYRPERPAHVAFLSCTAWHHDMPLNVRALVLPWLASLRRIVKEPSGTVNDVTILPIPPETSTQEGLENDESPARLF